MEKKRYLTFALGKGRLAKRHSNCLKNRNHL